MISIDLIVISVFLILTLAIGMYYGRGIRSFQEYAVGNKKMSTMVLTLSLIATIYGGGNLSNKLDASYHKGWYAFLLDLSAPMNLYLSARFMIPRMKEFMGHLSIAESMGSIYGKVARMVTACFGIIMAIVFFAVQIKIGLTVIGSLFPEIATFSTHTTILITLFIILYATFGGARSVAVTDVYQFLLFGLCFPVLIFVLLYYAKDPITGWHKVTNMANFDTRRLLIWNDAVKDLLTCFIWRSIFPFDPARTQRIYMASSIWQAIKTFRRTAIIRMLIPLLFLSVAVTLHISNHCITPNKHVWLYIIELQHFNGMKGILITVILALIMSTADSYLHVASVLFTNDLWPFFFHTTKYNDRSTLKVVRVASICIGLIGFWLAWKTTHISQLFNRWVSPYLPIVTAPFIMTTLGFRPRTAVLLSSMGINITIVMYYVFYQGKILSEPQLFVSFICSIIILLTAHYLWPSRVNTGWIGIKDSSTWELQNQITRKWWSVRLQQLKSLFTKAYWINVFPRKERTFILLGIYWIVYATIALFFIQKRYWHSYIYLYMAIMAIGTVIALYPALHSYKKGGNMLLHGLWPILLFLLLFIVPLQVSKLSHCSPMVWALWITSLSLAVFLLSFQVSLILLVITLLLHKLIPPYIPFGNIVSHGLSSLSIEFLLAMVLISMAIVGLGMYSYLQDKSAAKLTIKDLTRTYEHKISLEAIYNQANWSKLHALDNSKLLKDLTDQFKGSFQDLYENHSHKLKHEIDRFIGNLYKFRDTMLWRAQEERSLKLDKDALQLTAIEPMILKANQYILDLGNPIALLLRKQTTLHEILVDPALFECLLLLNLCEITKSKQAEDHIVTLTIQDTTLQYSADPEPLTLPALAFYFSTDTIIQKTLAAYLVIERGASPTLPASQEQFYQIESSQMVEAHGGYAEIVETRANLTCLYVFPVKGHQVMRFKNYSPTHLVGGKIAETSESLAQEKELISLLTLNTSLTQERVMQVIAFIKNAHGLVKRKSGAPYYTHPMATAKILLAVTQDPVTILAGLLHDVVEDTPIMLNQIEIIYGPQVAYIIDQVTHYNTHGYPWKLEKEEQRAILEACGDIRVVQVKLADQLHNMRTLPAHKPADQQRIAQETLTFYIPWGKLNKGPESWLMEMQQIVESVIN